MKNKKRKWIIIIVLALIVVGLGIGSVVNKNLNALKNMGLEQEVEYTVAKGDISISVSGSGNVYPADRRLIRSEVNGIVDEIFVSDGEPVEKDQMLLSLKSNNTGSGQTELSSIKLSIERSQKELNDLYEKQKQLAIYAPISGVVSDFKLEAGDQLGANAPVGKIKDINNAYFEAYFNKASFEKITIGDTASLLVNDFFTTITGTVVEKDSTPVQKGAGAFGLLVTIKTDNPGGYSVGDLAQVTVENYQGSFQSMDKAQMAATKEEQIIAKIGGKVKSTHIKNGEKVTKGDLIATIEDDLSLSIAEKQNAIAKFRSQLEELEEGNTLYSPIKGTVLKVAVAEEDVVDRATVLVTVADLANMEVKIAVDELDINKIKAGQEVEVTSEVYPTEKFRGIVSKMALEGAGQSGVTTYEVTIALDDRKSLMAGMSVDIEISAESREDVLVVPIEALKKVEGKYTATVKDVTGNKSDVDVTLGLVTKNMVEITAGLNEGDIIVYKKLLLNDYNNDGFIMGFDPPGREGGNHPQVGGNR
ncbi:MAG: HlyD family efflux transporter periplasmic adaptor subunit [Bacillota bacterium]